MKYTQTTMPKTRDLVKHLIYSVQYEYELKKAKVPFMDLFSYTSLQKLELRGPLSKHGNLDQISKWQALEFLAISYATALKIPTDITTLSKLTTLELYGLPKEMYCPEMANLKGLKRLSLRNCDLTEIPDFVFELSELEELDLAMNKIKVLDPKIKRLKKLRKLELTHNVLEAVPQELEYLTLLEELDLGGNKLTAIPEFFPVLTELRRLNLVNNALEKCPETIPTCQKLEKFAWMGNPFGDFPKVLFYLDLKTLNPVNHDYGHRDNAETVLKVLRGCKKVVSTDLQKEQIASIYQGNETAIKALSKSALLELLPLTQKVLQLQILKILYERDAQKLLDQPLKEGAVVFFVGKITLKKSEVRALFKSYGIKYSTKYSAEVTHLVLGENAKKVELFLDSTAVLINEQNVQDYLQEMDTPYLLETEASEGLNIEHISSLLLSSDIDNVGLGIELLKGGGVPKELLTELFIVYKLCEDKNKKKAARELLKLNGSMALQKALKSRKKLTGYSWSIKEAIEGTELEPWKIAQYGCRTAYNEYKRSINLGLTDAPEDKAKDFAAYVLDKSCSGGYLSLDDMNAKLIDYMYVRTDLKVFYSFNSLGLRNIPDGISALVNLREFSLMMSKIEKLPADFGQLNLSRVSFENIPFENVNAEIKKLTEIATLKELTISIEEGAVCDQLANLQQISTLKFFIKSNKNMYYKEDNTQLTDTVIKHLSQLKQLKKLKIIADTNRLPVAFCTNMSLLEQLEVDCKKMESFLNIPTEIGLLKHLVRLSITSKIVAKDIPDSFRELKALERLELTFIDGELPDCFTDLTQLKHLVLNGLFTALPAWISNYEKLEVIEIHQAEIADPQHFVRQLNALKNLKKVKVHKTNTFGEQFKIKTFPDLLPDKEVDVRSY